VQKDEVRILYRPSTLRDTVRLNTQISLTDKTDIFEQASALS